MSLLSIFLIGTGILAATLVFSFFAEWLQNRNQKEKKGTITGKPSDVPEPLKKK